jgi:hypothetical protein
VYDNLAAFSRTPTQAVVQSLRQALSLGIHAFPHGLDIAGLQYFVQTGAADAVEPAINIAINNAFI